MKVIAQIHEIFDNYDIATEILVASVRNPTHVIESARIGADIATMPPAVLFGAGQAPAHRQGHRAVPGRLGEGEEPLAARARPAASKPPEFPVIISAPTPERAVGLDCPGGRPHSAG